MHNDARPSVPRQHYRADIDGLRAVAILGVLAFHLQLGGVTGGFGGVDVFFVISGFLIAGIIRGELEAGEFSLSNFYLRRIRRIVPALFTCLLGTTVAAALILFPYDFLKFSQSLVRAALGLSNFYFAQRSNDYFSSAAAEKPLLHTWSLGIEEQFYAVFPLLVMLLFRFRRQIIVPAMAAAAAASLAYSAYAVSQSPAPAFFSTGGRVWELLLGTMLAFGILPQVRNQMVREAEALLGAAMIGACYFGYSEGTPFPGFAALPLCAGALLIIHAGIGTEDGGGLPRTMVARLLAAPPAVALGKISFSVYLWHWPLLALARYRFPETFGAELESQAGLLLLALSLALGILSWRLIETPFRRAPAVQTPWKVFASAFAMLALLLGGARVVAGKPESLQGWSPEIVKLDAANGRNLKPTSAYGVAPAREEGWPGDTTIMGSGKGEIDTLLWGDSHALAILPGLHDYVVKSGKRMIVAARPGCQPLIDIDFSGNRFADVCRGLNDRTLAALIDSKIKRVILAGRWMASAGAAQDKRRKAQSARKPKRKEFEPALEDTVDRIVALGKEVVIIGPVPEYPFNVIAVAERHAAWGIPLPEEVTLENFVERGQRVLTLLSRLDQKDGTDIVYPHLRLCGDGTCHYLKDGVPLYVDDDHLSAAGAGELRDMYAEVFTRKPELTTASQ
ncbi:MAG TPA: acyltransferase family protein [Hyphomicrobium sp.]|nr:acyltransferase family protein [Hyphomicrobium sp.]